MVLANPTAYTIRRNRALSEYEAVSGQRYWGVSNDIRDQCNVAHDFDVSPKVDKRSKHVRSLPFVLPFPPPSFPLLQLSAPGETYHGECSIG
jgi:hypothetical protein